MRLGLAIISCVLFGMVMAACQPVDPLVYPTFTPLRGFQPLGGDPSPAVPTPAASRTLAPQTPTPHPTPTYTSSPELPDSPTPPQDTPVPPTPEDPVITLVFTGQIVPARCVQAETDRLGQADYIYEGVLDLLTSGDLTVGALNASISEYAPATGCVETFVLVGKPEQADAMRAAGFDVMSVATNHIKNCGLSNCGDIAFNETLENLRRVGILPVGAGANLAEAVKPVYVEVKGVTIAFVSLGQIEPLAFAGPNTPGIGVLTEASLREQIQIADQNADFVVFLPHWGPEYTHTPNISQISLAMAAVEAGADLIVGNHTHYIQAMVEWRGVPIYFGLGNFVFDQTQEPQRQQSLVLRLTLEGMTIVSTELVPVVNEITGRVRIATPDEASSIFATLQAINREVQESLP